MRSAGGGPLTIAEDVVDWNIAAATRDIALSPVIDDECRVGKPSMQRFDLHLAAPAWQRGDSCFEIDRHHRATRTSRGLGKSPLVQSDQLALRAFGFGHALDRRTVVSRHIRHTPTVPGWIDFDFRRNPRRGKRLSEFVFRVRLALVVVRCDTEVHPRLDLRREQMRAVRLIRDQTAPVKGGAGANAIWKRGGRLDHQRTAHTVALGPELLRLV